MITEIFFFCLAYRVTSNLRATLWTETISAQASYWISACHDSAEPLADQNSPSTRAATVLLRSINIRRDWAYPRIGLGKSHKPTVPTAEQGSYLWDPSHLICRLCPHPSNKQNLWFPEPWFCPPVVYNGIIFEKTFRRPVFPMSNFFSGCAESPLSSRSSFWV